MAGAAYDVLLEDGDLPAFTGELSAGPEITVQAVGIRLGTHRGEWPLDETAGLPYLAWLQQKPPDVAGIALALRREIAATSGVRRVLSLTGVRNRTTRTLTFTGRVLLESGETVELLVTPVSAGAVNRTHAFTARIGRIANPGITP